MTTIGAGFHPFLAIANCLFSCPANPTDIYTVSIRPNEPTHPASAIATPVQQSRTVQAPQVLRPRPKIPIR
jgi:hypothetical protein